MSEHESDLGSSLTPEADYLKDVQVVGKNLWNPGASQLRQQAQRHVSHTDVAGAGYAARRDTRRGLVALLVFVYALIVALLIAGLNLPVGWTWLAALLLIGAIAAGTGMRRMHRVRGRILPR